MLHDLLQYSVTGAMSTGVVYENKKSVFTNIHIS